LSLPFRDRPTTPFFLFPATDFSPIGISSRESGYIFPLPTPGKISLSLHPRLEFSFSFFVLCPNQYGFVPCQPLISLSFFTIRCLYATGSLPRDPLYVLFFAPTFPSCKLLIAPFSSLFVFPLCGSRARYFWHLFSTGSTPPSFKTL